MAAWLRGEIEKSFAAPWHAAVERNVFGELSAKQIVEALDDACAAAFGAGLKDGFLYRVSVGCVVGCRLVDGREVILKAYQRRWTPEFLLAVKRVQSHLHDNGFPCPAPIGEPLRVAGAVVLAEHVLSSTRGSRRRPKKRCRCLPPDSLGLWSSARTSTSQRSHVIPSVHPTRASSPSRTVPSSIDATRVGAEWIDEIGRHAKAIRDEDQSDPVVAHTD